MPTSTPSWTAETTRKLYIAMTVGAVVYFFLVAMPAWSLGPELYGMGRDAVADALGVPVNAVSLKKLAGFEFSETGPSGRATFVLCGPASACFTIVASKSDGRWELESMEPL